MLNCLDGCFTEVVVESPIRRVDDAMGVRIVVNPGHGQNDNKNRLLAFDWPQSEYLIPTWLENHAAASCLSSRMALSHHRASGAERA